jgi:hypothetical protein
VDSHNLQKEQTQLLSILCSKCDVIFTSFYTTFARSVNRF